METALRRKLVAFKPCVGCDLCKLFPFCKIYFLSYASFDAGMPLMNQYMFYSSLKGVQIASHSASESNSGEQSDSDDDTALSSDRETVLAENDRERASEEIGCERMSEENDVESETESDCERVVRDSMA